MTTMSGWQMSAFPEGLSLTGIYQSVDRYCQQTSRISSKSLWKKDSAMKQLREIATLIDNWDGYGGARVEHNAISNAQALLDYLTEYPQYMMPSTAGTLLLEWGGPRGKASLELGRETFSFYAAPKVGRPIFLGGNLRGMETGDINVALATILGSPVPQSLEIIRQHSSLSDRVESSS